jgi:hypothetical protein
MVADVGPEDGVKGLGLITQVVPLGTPLHESATASENPFNGVIVTVVVLACPTEIVSELLESVAL